MIIEHDIRFGGQKTREGLGAGRYLANPTSIDRRSLLARSLLDESEKVLVAHSSCLVRQGVWTHWDGVRPFDMAKSYFWPWTTSTKFCSQLSHQLYTHP